MRRFEIVMPSGTAIVYGRSFAHAAHRFEQQFKGFPPTFIVTREILPRTVTPAPIISNEEAALAAEMLQNSQELSVSMRLERD